MWIFDLMRKLYIYNACTFSFYTKIYTPRWLTCSPLIRQAMGSSPSWVTPNITIKTELTACLVLFLAEILMTLPIVSMVTEATATNEAPTPTRKKTKMDGSVRMKNSLTNPTKVTPGKRLFSCDVCGRTFSSKYNHWEHSLVHKHGSSYQCDICQKRFRHQSSLRRHIMSHDPASRKPFTCHVCGKGVMHPPALEYHLTFHLNRHCPKCGLLFTSIEDIKGHAEWCVKVKSEDSQQRNETEHNDITDHQHADTKKEPQ